jgi:hypothetical protein
MNTFLQKECTIKGYKPLYVTSEFVYAAKNNKLYTISNSCNDIEYIGKYPMGMSDYLPSKSRIFTRLLRSGFHSVVPLNDGSIIALTLGKIVHKSSGSNIFTPVFNIPRGRRPLNICHSANCTEMYFGEYFDNRDRDEVNIYGSHDGQKWYVAYTFKKGAIRHVHGVYHDQYRDGYWVLTGDDDEECQILFTDDNFTTLNVAFAGKQKYRAVTIIPKEYGLIVPTDTPLEKNYIQWFDVNSNRQEIIQEITGSVFYSATVQETMFISVIVEPSKINLNKYAKILVSKNGGTDWETLISDKKDRLSPKYFQYGSFMIPSHSHESNMLYVYGTALANYDDTTISFNLNL